jgi:hypothetical protein
MSKLPGSRSSTLWCSSLPVIRAFRTDNLARSQNGLTQVFGGFVAYGISFYDGHALAPYKIIYIMLGGLAIVVGQFQIHDRTANLEGD